MMTDHLMVWQVQLESGRANNQMLPANAMHPPVSAHPGSQQRGQSMAWAGMQGLEGSSREAFASIGCQTYAPLQRKQLLQPLSLHNTVTSGMPLPEQRLDMGSLESAQFAGNNMGGLASLNSATANAICRTALFNQSDGQAAARNIVLTVAPTSAAPPQPPPPAFKRSLVDMETMPSAESQKAADMPPAAAAVYAAQPSSGVATRGLRQGARRNPPRYSDFTDDLSDTDSPGESYDEEEEDLDGFSEDNSSRRIGLRSRGSSLQSADASQFRSAMSGGDSGREGRRGGSGGVAPKRPRSKSLLCEQDPEAPGLTLEQRRKIRRCFTSVTFLDTYCTWDMAVHRPGNIGMQASCAKEPCLSIRLFVLDRHVANAQ